MGRLSFDCDFSVASFGYPQVKIMQSAKKAMTFPWVRGSEPCRRMVVKYQSKSTWPNVFGMIWYGIGYICFGNVISIEQCCGVTEGWKEAAAVPANAKKCRGRMFPVTKSNTHERVISRNCSGKLNSYGSRISSTDIRDSPKKST